MSHFTYHDKHTAPADAVPLMEAAESTFGFVPNLVAVMAESPALTEGYLKLTEIFDKSGLSPVERQVVLLAVSRYHACHYCMAAYTVLARMTGVEEPVIQALRDNRPVPDARLEALRAFTVDMLEQRGWVSDEAVQRFVDAGFTRGNVGDVLVGIALKTMSNYINHMAGTEVDQAFAAGRWSPQAA